MGIWTIRAAEPWNPVSVIAGVLLFIVLVAMVGWLIWRSAQS